MLGLLCPAIAQVVTPIELNDPKLQRLQQRNFRKLVDIGSEIQRYKFPYPFYFSRVLDVDLAKMKEVDQRSIRFDIYKGETVLEITGNYYASYNADSMNAEARLKATFEQVIVPMLKIEVPALSRRLRVRIVRHRGFAPRPRKDHGCAPGACRERHLHHPCYLRAEAG